MGHDAVKKMPGGEQIQRDRQTVPEELRDTWNHGVSGLPEETGGPDPFEGIESDRGKSADLDERAGRDSKDTPKDQLRRQEGDGAA